MRNELKSTPIGLLPNDWDIGMLGEYLDYIQPTKYITKSFNETGNTPVLTANKAFILGYTDESEGIYNEVPVIIFDDFTTASKFVDFPFKVRSSALKILAFKTKAIDINYLYESLKRIKHQSAEHKRYWISEYQYLKIPLPPLPEQQKIAEILSTVDAKIEIIDQQVSETQELKKGLMQQLLTGKLSVVENRLLSEVEMKDSALGKIPKSWDVGKLKDIAKITSGGTPNRDVLEYWNGDIPWVTTSLIKFNYILNSDEYITQLALENSSAKLFPKGTILMAMYGQGVTRGKVSILNIEATTNQACCAIIVGSEIENIFLFYNLQSRYEELRGLSNAGGQKNLSGGIIKSILIAVPPIEEQRKVIEILTSVDSKLEVLSEKKTTYQEMKQGLMQQLLMGRLRVPQSTP